MPEVSALVEMGRITSVELEIALLNNGVSSAVDAAEKALTITRWLTFFDAELHTVPAGPYEIIRGRRMP